MKEITLNGVTVRAERDGCGLRVNESGLDPSVRRAFQQTGTQSFIQIRLAQDCSPNQIAEEIMVSTDRDCHNLAVKLREWCKEDRIYTKKVLAALVKYYERPVQRNRPPRTEDSSVTVLPTS